MRGGMGGLWGVCLRGGGERVHLVILSYPGHEWDGEDIRGQRMLMFGYEDHEYAL